MQGHPDSVAFTPVTVGTMSLDRRLVVSSHSGGGGALLGAEEQFERHCAVLDGAGDRRRGVGRWRPDVRRATR